MLGTGRLVEPFRLHRFGGFADQGGGQPVPAPVAAVLLEARVELFHPLELLEGLGALLVLVEGRPILQGRRSRRARSAPHFLPGFRTRPQAGSRRSIRTPGVRRCSCIAGRVPRRMLLFSRRFNIAIAAFGRTGIAASGIALSDPFRRRARSMACLRLHGWRAGATPIMLSRVIRFASSSSLKSCRTHRPHRALPGNAAPRWSRAPALRLHRR